MRDSLLVLLVLSFSLHRVNVCQRSMERERRSSPPAEQILQSSHDVGIAHEKALFFAGGRLVYRIVLALKITDVLRESSRGLVPGESQCLGQHGADEIEW